MTTPRGLHGSTLWPIAISLLYCLSLLGYHWQANLPLRLGLVTAAGFLLTVSVLSFVRARCPESIRQALVTILGSVAYLCWGPLLSPFILMMSLGDPELWGRGLILGLGPWAIAWAVGGTDCRPWLRDIRRRLLACALFTWLLFLIPHVFIVGSMFLKGIGLSVGWATYLALLTGVLLVTASSRFFAFLDQAAVQGRLHRGRVLLLKGATVICLFMLLFPPWTVTEQVLGARQPASQLLEVTPLGPPFGRATLRGIPDPRYGSPRTSYEPWYLCFYRGPLQWVGPDISGPAPLRRIPRSDEERIYVRYRQPNRRLSLDVRRWLVPPGITALLGVGLFAVLRDRRAQATLR